MTGWLYRWFPSLLFLIGAGTVSGLVAPQRAIPLQAPLESVVPTEIGEFLGESQEISEAEATAAGVTDYLFKVYTKPGSDGREWISLYVGYYESQTQGKTIHSPKNCLPGGGWEPLSSVVASIPVSGWGLVSVNRYLLQQEGERVMVLYWYQGRGRVAQNEYAVKFDLLRDAALRRRTDEALVRVVVPLTGTEQDAFRRAEEVAELIIPALERALPN